ncbi:MAG: low molecular weight phosphatase family protein [Acidimicrobiia bacterium]|nr:low molecular weight phosphatase family protein [Acidimicrobiia bacterium]
MPRHHPASAFGAPDGPPGPPRAPAGDAPGAASGAASDATAGTGVPRWEHHKWSEISDSRSVTRFLIVCTANRCRSPMAEQLLRERLRSVATPTLVSSAGTLAEEGLPATRDALTVAGGPEGHASRRLVRSLVESADLVLCMTRDHLREVVTLSPAAFIRTYTLRDLARRGAAAGPRRPGESIETWLTWVGTGRRPSDLVGHDDSDDVADPVGRPVEAYRRCAADLDSLLAEIVA